MRAKRVLWAVLTPLMMLTPAAAADVLTVYFSPSETTVGVGAIFDVEIRADNLDEILGWGIDFTMSAPDVVDFLGVEVDDPWIQANGLDDDDLCGVANFASAPISGSDILIATLSFKATAEGDVDLTLSETMGDLTEGWPTTGEPGSFVTATYMPGVIHVVPEPGSLASFTALLAGAVLVGRRRTQ